MAMKDAVKTLINSPATFVIVILILLLALLFTVKAASRHGETANKIEHGETITSVEYYKAR